MLHIPFKAPQKIASSVSLSSWKEMSQQQPPSLLNFFFSYQIPLCFFSLKSDFIGH